MPVVLFAPFVVFRRPDRGEVGPEPVGPLFGPFTRPLAALLPVGADNREEARKRLLLAGHYRPTALDDFLALRAVLTLTPPLVCWGAALFVGGTAVLAFFLLGLVLGVLGFALTGLIVQAQGNSRAERVRRGLPTFMDTLALVLSTGMSLPRGMRRSADAIERGYPDLSQEVRLVTAQAELRSMADALDAWRRRIPVPELGSLVFLLGQADRQGTDITRGLWELSDSFRTASRQRAEAAANRANFVMLFPTVFCLLMAAGIVLAGPPLVQVREGLEETQRVIREAREKAEEAERSARENAERVTGRPPAPPPAPPPTATPAR